MQLVPLFGTSEVTFDLDDENRHDIAKLPANIKPKTERQCGIEVRTAVAVSFKKIQKFLRSNGGRYSIISNIMGISVGDYNSTYVLPKGENITIRLNHVKETTNAEVKCVFLNWNTTKTTPYGVWDTYGCTTVTSKEGFTECQCNHLTNFAILVDFSERKVSEYDDNILSLLSCITTSFSSVSLILTIIVYTTIRSLRSRRNTFTCNLAICLLCMNILVQTKFERVGRYICYVISALLQYCVLSAFMWMLLEGALLYKMVILVFESSRIRLPIFYGLAYGIPLFIIILSFSLNPNQMIRERYCWPSSEKGAIWSVVGPIVLIITVNIIIFALTMNAAFRIDKMNANNKLVRERKNNLIRRLKGMLSLTCLLGFTWVVGFFYVPGRPEVSAYLFVILNGLQTSTWNTFLPNNKQLLRPKEAAEEKSNVIFSDICPNSLYAYDNSMYSTAPPQDAVRHNSKMSLFYEEMDKRHPFEINYGI